VKGQTENFSPDTNAKHGETEKIFRKTQCNASLHRRLAKHGLIYYFCAGVKAQTETFSQGNDATQHCLAKHSPIHATIYYARLETNQSRCRRASRCQSGKNYLGSVKTQAFKGFTMDP
jgi:hypothetical protein